MNTLHKLLALAALALMSLTALAQDATLDLTHPDKNEHQSVWSITRNGVKAEYIPEGTYSDGASIYSNWRNDYDIKFTASKAIAVIELDGITDNRSNAYTSDVACTTGTLKMYPNETSIWKGNATAISFYGKQVSTRYYFTEARIWFVGTPYGKQYVKDPVISVNNGVVKFDTETPNASFTYSMQFDADGKVRMCDGTAPLNFPLVVNVQGEAAGYEKSPTTTTTIPLTTLRGKKGDANGDGKVTTQDVQTIVDNLLNKTAK